MDSPISLIVSVVALGVSVWSTLRTVGVTRDQKLIQGRLLSLEAGRERDRVATAASAQLRAVVQRAGSNAHLVIQNVGSSEARAIDITMDGKPLHEHERILVKQGEISRVLGPGASARYAMALSMGAPSLWALDMYLAGDQRTVSL